MSMLRTWRRELNENRKTCGKDKQTKDNRRTWTNSKPIHWACIGVRGEEMAAEMVEEASKRKTWTLDQGQMLCRMSAKFILLDCRFDAVVGSWNNMYATEWTMCNHIDRIFSSIESMSIVFDSFLLLFENRKIHKCNCTNIGLFQSNAPFSFLFFSSFAPQRSVAFEFLLRFFCFRPLLAATPPIWRVWVVVKVVEWHRRANGNCVHESHGKVIAIERKEDENFSNFGRFNQLAFSSCVGSVCDMRVLVSIV